MRQNLPPQRLHKRILPYRIVCRHTNHTEVAVPTSDLCFSEPTVFENYVHDIFIDNVHVELSLWDTAGQEEFDRLRSLSYDDTHAIMLCFSVDSPDSLENVESKWVGEIAENCPGVKLVLVALKCDLREMKKEEDEEAAQEGEGAKRQMVDYKQGLAVAEKIKALRYLGEFASQSRLLGLGDGADFVCRVLSDEESRCQRSLYGSRASSITGQERQRRQKDRLLHDNVKSILDSDSTRTRSLGTYERLPTFWPRGHKVQHLFMSMLTAFIPPAVLLVSSVFLATALMFCYNRNRRWQNEARTEGGEMVANR